MASPQTIRELTPEEVATPAFLRLLWFAVEVDDDSLRTIRDETLPHLTVIGAADPEVIAFAAYHLIDPDAAHAIPAADGGRDRDGDRPGRLAGTDSVGARPGTACTRPYALVEYIAVAERVRAQGWGTRLIDAIADRHPSLPIHAQTDDDAVDFYRRVGFDVTPAPRDPRWPERQRYDCARDARET